MKRRVVAFAWLAASIAAANCNAHASGVNYGKFQDGTKTYVCFEGTFLLDSENLSARKKLLNVGDEVEIIKASEKTASRQALEDIFYRVKVGGAEGYLWGGQLAKAWLPLKTTPGILVIGLTGIPAGLGGHAAIAEVIANHKIVSRCRFGAITTPEGETFAYSLDIIPWTEAKFTGNPQLFRVQFEYGACDYTNGDAILVLRGNQIRHAMDAMFSGNEEGGRSFRYILPKDKGGMKDRLTIENTEGLNTDKKKHITRDIYTWNGKHFEHPKRPPASYAPKQLWKDSPQNGGAF